MPALPIFNALHCYKVKGLLHTSVFAVVPTSLAEPAYFCLHSDPIRKQQSQTDGLADNHKNSSIPSTQIIGY